MNYVNAFGKFQTVEYLDYQQLFGLNQADEDLVLNTPEPESRSLYWYGTDKNDARIDGNGASIMYGRGGDDLLIGNGGNDWLHGESGDDRLEGGTGHDKLYGGSGADNLDGGSGNDTAYYDDSSAAVHVNLEYLSGFQGDAQGDTLLNIEGVVGSNFNDTLVGDSLNNSLNGNRGSNFLDGAAGDDFLLGGYGDESDTLYGGAGNDTLQSGTSNDLLAGETGDDSYVFLADSGIDTIVELTGEGVDTLQIGGMTESLYILKNGDHLFLSSNGVDFVGLANWYVGTSYQGMDYLYGVGGAMYDMHDIAALAQDITPTAAQGYLGFNYYAGIETIDLVGVETTFDGIFV